MSAFTVVDGDRTKDHWIRRRRYLCHAGHLHYSPAQAEGCVRPCGRGVPHPRHEYRDSRGSLWHGTPLAVGTLRWCLGVAEP